MDFQSIVVDGGLNYKTTHRFRIIVYRDSNVHAHFSERRHTFPVQLSHYLDKYGVSDVEVINAGVSGFDPDQNLIRFTEEADIYRPALVVFHVFADNDFGDIIRNRLFSLDADGSLMRTNIKLSPPHSQVISGLLTVKAIRKIIRLLAESDDEYIDQLRKLCDTEYSAYKKEGKAPLLTLDYYDIDVALDSERDSSKTKIRLMEEVLKEASNVARKKNIKFLVLIQLSVIDLTVDNFQIGYKYLQKYPNY